MDWRVEKLKLPGMILAISASGLAVWLTLPARWSEPGFKASEDMAAIEQSAKSITVKVLAGESWGSGILISHHGQRYQVLTNAHVLVAADPPYRIQTPDEKIYIAEVVWRGDAVGGNDVALLQFRGEEGSYPVANLGTTPAVGDAVFASGFPWLLETDGVTPPNPGFRLTVGQVSLVLDKALAGGYQLGYTNDIEKGMSGGPVMNSGGEVVAMNGMHAYPLWGDPYVFQDGSLPPKQMREQMIPLAFAMSMQRLREIAPLAITDESFRPVGSGANLK